MKKLYLILMLSAVPTLGSTQNLPDPIADTDYRLVRIEEARLGQLLFYDPILSGNQTIACATCHHPKHGTSDAVSLSFGDGGIGLGPNRRADPDNLPVERIPRNAPALFNLGAHEFTVMFHDGRLEADATRPDGIRTPLGEDMLQGFASVLSAQSMFPVLSRDEMAGDYDENPVGKLVRQGRITGADGAWGVLSARVGAIPHYAEQFSAVYPHIEKTEDITFADISNAIAAFMEHEWRSDSAPFDAVLRGKATLTDASQRGMDLFYGEAQCANCHAGAFLTDHKFHVMGDPQIGPGKSATFENHHRDDGRFRVTGKEQDRYAFRTPSLRNVHLTGPYGHAGGHSNLKDYLTHHIDPTNGLQSYDPKNAVLPPFHETDFIVMQDASQVTQIAAAITTPPSSLTLSQLDDLVAFLETLTDPVSIDGRLGVPDSLPSGLPLP